MIYDTDAKETGYGQKPLEKGRVLNAGTESMMLEIGKRLVFI
jgi:hypothetical protein